MFDAYNARMSALGGYEGNVRRNNSQKIMDASWMRDTATRPVYVKWVDSGLPTIGEFDEVLYAKYNVKSYHNITGDAVEYLLQFKLEDMKNRSDIKVGSYVQIYNEMNEPEWWLIVYYDDRPQFRQFSILKCTWTYRWVSEDSGHRVIYECLGAPRKQNSYNSGVWMEYIIQTPENQEVMWLPTNDDTKTIGYDVGFLKSEEGRYPPLKYTITKIEDTATKGITKFTMAQGQFNPEIDSAEHMIADYYKSYVVPIPDEPQESNEIEFVYSGKPSVRAGGSYKKFALKHINSNEEYEDITSEVTWSFESDNMNISNIERDSDVPEHSNIIKIKCANDYSLIGSTFNIVASCEYGSKIIVCEVISL